MVGRSANDFPPLSSHHPAAHSGPGQVRLKSAAEINAIRLAGQINHRLLEMVSERLQPGMTTGQIDQWIYDLTVAEGGRPATLGYKGFTKSCCISPNEVVCHGIPGSRILQEGDIVNVDVSTVLGGYFGDSSRMFFIGEVRPEARKLVEVTRECLDLGIAQVKPGNFVGDIGSAIQAHAEQHGYSVVRDFAGHGIGQAFHEEPDIPHYGTRGEGPPLLPGMVFTIEPMINAGDWMVAVLADGWTAITCDGSLSAQYEHTVAVTPDGVEILT